MSEDFLRRLNILIQCNPSQCQGQNCPLYYWETGKCLWENMLSAFESTIKIKFENRNPKEEED